MTIYDSASPDTSVGHGSWAFTYDGNPRKIFGKIIKYALLTLVSLGVYRFWAKTHLRRYFWSSVRLDGESFLYHGTAKELLIGFLLVFALVAVVSVANSFLQQWFIGDAVLAAIYAMVSAIVFLYIFHYAIYRMLRYRLSRTSWHGVRFALEGNAKTYAAKLLGLQGLDIISGFLLHPWVRAKALNLRLNNMRFGNVFFTSALSVRHLWKAYYLAWFMIAMSIICMLGILFAFTLPFFGTQDAFAPELWQKHVLNNVFYLWLIGLGSVLSLFAYIRYRFIEVKCLIGNLSFGELRIGCHLSVNRLTLLYFLFVLVYFTGFILLLSGAVLVLEFVHEIFAVFAFLSVYLFYYFFSLVLLSWLLGRILRHVRLDGDVSFLRHVSALRGEDMRYGEGLFDALDIGNF